MFPVSSSSRLFLYTAPADMRKSFDGLSGLVCTQMKADPLSGDVYLFINRRRDRVKILFWDRSGLALYYKRLEEGTFMLPDGSEPSVEITSAELSLILEGIDLSQAQRRKRFALPSSMSVCG